MMMQNFASMGLITVMWFLFVFSLCFGHTYWFWGSITTFGAFHNVNGRPLAHTAIGDTHPAGTIVGDIPGLVFAGYQGMFAVIAPPIVSGGAGVYDAARGQSGSPRSSQPSRASR